MARIARIKVKNIACWYHLYAKATGRSKEGPLAVKGAKEKLAELIEQYAKIYFCEVSTYCVMKDYYHIVVHFEAPKKLPKKKLLEKAKMFYPDALDKIKKWKDKDWENLQNRLFNVSEYMRSIQMAFPRWFNKNHKRKGAFWGERFKSTILTSEKVALDCMLFVDLAPVRADYVNRPEKWLGSAWALREKGKDRWLYNLSGNLGLPKGAQARRVYRAKLYHRGGIAHRGGPKVPVKAIDEEFRQGFARGSFLKNLRYFTDGLVVGSEKDLQRWVDYMRQEGRYLRRINPIVQEEGGNYSLREQRSHYVD